MIPTIAFLLVAQSAAQYHAAVALRIQTQQVYMACMDAQHSIAACRTERNAYEAASDAVQAAIAAEMQVRTPEIEAVTNDLNRIIAKMHAYSACRRAKHWWQFWKRCRY